MSIGLPEGIERRFAQLGRDNPDWQPYLTLISTALAIGGESRESAPVRAALDDSRPRGAPALTGATLTLSRAWLEATVGRLAEEFDSGMRATLSPPAGLDAWVLVELVEAALDADEVRLDAVARRLDVAPAKLGTLAGALAVSVLRLLEPAREATPGWGRGYCPTCGAWAALSESRGLERQRRARCGRCGDDWELLPLTCIYCGATDHPTLQLLFAEGEGERRRAETCDDCGGYAKVVTTLRRWSVPEVILGDLGSLELDIAAAARGYGRPDGPGHLLGVRVRLSEES